MKDPIEMAREVGLLDSRDDWSSVPEEYMTCIKDFEALVREDEREACAKVCESLFDMDDDSCNEAEQCAKAIRARGNT